MGKTETVKCCSPDGRIRIPKGMREILGITGSEPLIFRTNGKSLILEKYQELETLEGVCSLYLRAFANNCRCPAIICNTEHILASRGVPLSTAQTLSAKIRQYILKADVYRFDETEWLDLFGDSKYRVDSLFPIQGNNGPAGAVLLLHYRDITQSEQLCAALLADIVSEQIKNQ